MRLRLLAGASAFMLLPASAFAGASPLNRPAQDWVEKAPLDAAHLGADAPELLILDTQARIAADGTLWTYTDRAVRVSSTEALGQLATLTLPWAPDKGDLIIHEASILRNGQTIDLLVAGKPGFTVLRREEALEALELTGILTATMPVEGLQVGDILRLRYSITLKDSALAGHADVVSGLVAAPLRIGFGRDRVEWPTGAPAHWHVTGTGIATTPYHAGSFTGIEVALPLAKRPDMPEDAPPRYHASPMIEASTFASWDEVSRVMAPLYSTDGVILPGSPLAAVLADVKAAPTPMARTEAALRHVQDDVRYLAIVMGNGGYVPQKPADTWSKRYGDCKAKTLLLLALLRGAGIQAEPVLANSALGDMLPERLPSASAFDHIFVRATVDGQVLWLDGTGAGTRLADLTDTPALRYVLPLRAQGAGLIAISLHASAQPMIAIDVDSDESTSIDLPSAVAVKVVMRGPLAAGFFAISARLDGRQRNTQIEAFFNQALGQGQWVDPNLATDTATGTATLSARGIMDGPWRRRDRQMQRRLSLALKDFKFAPDRARPQWAQIPVVVAGPVAVAMHLTLHLPDGGKGFTVEGAGNASAQFAGQEMTRRMTLTAGLLTLDEHFASLGGEIPAAAIPQERDRIDAVLAGAPRLIAPIDTPRAWALSVVDGGKPGQLSSVDAVLAAAIKNREPDDVSPFTTRASVRAGIGNYAGAIADFTAALAINPDVETYLARARIESKLGQYADVLGDAQKARAIDPSSVPATDMTAQAMAQTGNLAGATALLDQRVELGGDARDGYRKAKAALLGDYGDPQAALTLLGTLIADKPGNPALLNERCWVKATHGLMLDTALKDCTEAIELSNSTAAALDSRAMVWFRMGRFAEAQKDLDAVIAEVPDLGKSRFMRAVVEKRLGNGAAAATDLAIARKLDPDVEHLYARYGITL